MDAHRYRSIAFVTDAEQPVTDAEQPVTDAEQSVTDAEQSVTDAEQSDHSLAVCLSANSSTDIGRENACVFVWLY